MIKIRNIHVTAFMIFAVSGTLSSSADCDEFVSWVAPAKNAYQKMHRNYPLADFAGLFAPPRRLMGFYIGRDGPPGYSYYALPAYIPLVDFAARGAGVPGTLSCCSS